MRPSRPHVRRLIVAWAAFQFAAGPCFAQDDPWERTNRKLFAFQDAIDRHLVGPFARGYGKAPAPLRTALRNFNRNLKSPVVMVNDLLQGRIGQGATTLGRLAINTTFGLLGFIDVANATGVPPHDNDFGLTLARWGAKPGPYMFLPIIGPTTLRDAFGEAADVGLNPLTYAQFSGQTELSVTSYLTTEIDLRAEVQDELQAVRRMSTDPYATIRSYYLQGREAEIRGKPGELAPLPELDFTPGPEPTPPVDQPPAPPETETAPEPEPQTSAAPGPAAIDAPIRPLSSNRSEMQFR